MAKKRFEYTAGPLPILGVYPTIMIGANVDGKPDFATVAWTGVAAKSVLPGTTRSEGVVTFVERMARK